ncbi:hypothetical protein FOA52_009950 [Chlamydomonas sp. UWO 241]|nr:hypothetical protein FOA52_009950 [Chlamydomonas sp. UWO 241]
MPTNFLNAEYRGDDGALLPIEDALPGMGRDQQGCDQHTYVYNKLMAAVALRAHRAQAQPAYVAEGGSDGGSNSDCDSDIESVSELGSDQHMPAASTGAAEGGYDGGSGSDIESDGELTSDQHMSVTSTGAAQGGSDGGSGSGIESDDELDGGSGSDIESGQHMSVSAVLPAAGPLRDYRARAAAVAYLRELKAAFNEDVLTLVAYQKELRRVTAELGFQEARWRLYKCSLPPFVESLDSERRHCIIPTATVALRVGCVCWAWRALRLRDLKDPICGRRLWR